MVLTVHTSENRPEIPGKFLNVVLEKNGDHFDQGRIKLFSAPRQWKHFRPLFQAVFLLGGGITPQTVKHHASQSKDRNNKYIILYTEFCVNNKI